MKNLKSLKKSIYKFTGYFLFSTSALLLAWIIIRIVNGFPDWHLPISNFSMVVAGFFICLSMLAFAMHLLEVKIAPN